MQVVTGQDLRAAREAKRIGLGALANLIGRSKGHLSRVENGDRPVTPALIRDYERSLGVRVAATNHLQELMPDPVTVEDMRRRQVFGAIAAATVGAVDASAAGLSRWLGSAEASTQAAIVDVMTDSDAHPAERFRQMRRVLADSDNLFGPSRVTPLVREQINIIDKLRYYCRSRDGQELLHVQIEFADLLAWLHQDSADYESARYWLDRALEWAHVAGDSNAVTFVLARKSQLAGDMREATEAVDVAVAAMNMASPGSRLGAIAATYAGYGYALAGDAFSCKNVYDRAADVLGTAEQDSEPWGMFFNAAYIEVHRGYSLALLGDHLAAATGFRNAIGALPAGYHRDRGVYLTWEALSYVTADRPAKRDVEQAATVGLRALAIGAETGSRRIMGPLAELAREVASWRDAPAVSAFEDAMQELACVGATDQPGRAVS